MLSGRRRGYIVHLIELEELFGIGNRHGQLLPVHLGPPRIHHLLRLGLAFTSDTMPALSHDPAFPGRRTPRPPGGNVGTPGYRLEQSSKRD